VKLSLVESTLLGAITAVVIWSLLTVSVGRFECGGVVVLCQISTFKELWVQQQQPLGANAARDQAVSTTEQSQPQSAVYFRDQPNTIRDTLQSSLGSLQLPTISMIFGVNLKKILGSADLQSLAG